jgi:hypothetical protein
VEPREEEEEEEEEDVITSDINYNGLLRYTFSRLL